MVKERKVYLDLLRIIAIIFVIYNHTNEKGYYLYAFDCPMYLRVLYIAAAALIAVAVPIFFMISGSLLIPKEETIKELYTKRVLKMVLVLVIFSVIQYAYQVVFENVELSLGYFLHNTISGSITPSYWYLYSYLAYLVCLPLLRKMARNMTDREFKYLLAAFIIVDGIISLIIFIFMKDTYNPFFEIPFFKNIIIFPLLGYYMEHRVDEERYNNKGILKWIVIMVLVLALIVGVTLYRDLPYEEFTTYDKGLFTTGFTLLLDVGVFYIVKTLFKNKKVPKAVSVIITTLGGTVFGVYLIETMLRESTQGVYEAINSVLPSFVSAWLWCLFVFIVGAIIIFVIKLIPGVKKLL